METERPPGGGGPNRRQSRYVASVLEPLLHDPALVRQELARVREELHATVTGVDGAVGQGAGAVPRGAARDGPRGRRHRRLGLRDDAAAAGRAAKAGAASG